MEIFIQNVPSTVSDIRLTQVLEPILHGHLFTSFAVAGAPINFKVYLFPDKRNRRQPHSGRGTLTVPTIDIGTRFIAYYNKGPLSSRVTVDGRILSFQRSNKAPRPDILGEVQRMPYRDPIVIIERERRLANLSQVVDLHNIQFAWQCRDDSLSIEWEWNDNPEDEHLGKQLIFNDETRELLVQKKMTTSKTRIAMRYSRILSVETDSSAKAIVFFLNSPPSYERENNYKLFDALFDGLFDLPNLPNPRTKLTHLNDEHAHVAPYTWGVLRVVCKSLSDLSEFRRMTEIANLIPQDRTRPTQRRGLFSSGLRRQLDKWLSSLDWSISFQCQYLYRELLLDTAELLDLRSSIEELIRKRGVPHTLQVLRQFGPHLRDIWFGYDDITVQGCFDQAKKEVDEGGVPQEAILATDRRLFQCLHATFTPTLVKLHGPFPDTSNRIIRLYPHNHQNFLRVSFTDEEGLQFRFDRREVDGPEFITRRVGSILKNGFTLSGRRFEFLAYSQSALKQYTVWFVNPFTDRRGRTITASHIRESIGSSWPKDLRRCPARYAARLSQAFTATEPGPIIESEQVGTIPDIERNGFCFSDGNGSMSQELAETIHDALQGGSGRTTRSRHVPSVIQVRILGAKGTLSVDPTLREFGILQRPSMIKYESTQACEVEIARSFSTFGNFFLNRPLVMILNGLGVDAEVFLNLQQEAVKKTREASQSLKGAVELLETHGMGASFALPSIFGSLRKLGFDLDKGSLSSWILRDAFMERCLKFAVHHVLREIKFRARVPVPESWKLVGVVDAHNILAPNQIFACVLKGGGGKPRYIKGRILISKSPTIHPGDVQIAEAIGEPPENSPLHALHNCVVFSQQGDRPLPNMLSGSDLDGDEYDLIQFKSLHPPRTVSPGNYDSTPRKLLNDNCTIDDVADFVVDYINNDTLGLVATNFLLIADVKGIFAPECDTLAQLHSWAVDFPKNGIPVPVKQIPMSEMRVKPDWYAPEISTGNANYYESQSALGKMFRAIRLPALSVANRESRAQQRRRTRKENISLEDTLSRLSLNSNSSSDPLSAKLRRRLVRLVDLEPSVELTMSVTNLFDQFADELEYICSSFTLSYKSTGQLTEEEVLMGTIVANTTQHRVRRDSTASMRERTTILVQKMWKELEGGENATHQEWANRAWTAWNISFSKKDAFGAKSFGFVALRAIFEVMKALDSDD